MPDEIRLAATPRSGERHPGALRRSGLVPGVMYGRHYAAQALEFDTPALERVLRRAGTTRLVTIAVGSEEHFALVRDLQRDPVTRALVHVDFYRVLADQIITSLVPIVHTGHSPAVERGGTVNQMIEGIEVECLPGDLPSSFTVDLSLLTHFGAHVSVGDLPVPPGVKVLSPATADVFRVMAPHVQEEAATEVAAEATAAPAATATPAPAARATS